MPKCDKCQQDFYKLTTHSRTKQKLCIRCITDDGCVRFRDEELVLTHDKRGSVRVPLTVNMTVSLEDGDRMEMRYPVFSVDLSLTGICFTWEFCPVCHGREAHPEAGAACFFAPFRSKNPDRRELALELQFGSFILKAKAYVVHILRDDDCDIEYIGAKFSYLGNHERRVLEKIIIKYGAVAAEAS